MHCQCLTKLSLLKLELRPWGLRFGDGSHWLSELKTPLQELSLSQLFSIERPILDILRNFAMTLTRLTLSNGQLLPGMATHVSFPSVSWLALHHAKVKLAHTETVFPNVHTLSLQYDHWPWPQYAPNLGHQARHWTQLQSVFTTLEGLKARESLRGCTVSYVIPATPSRWDESANDNLSYAWKFMSSARA